jgi:hypothetical protein
MYSFKYNQQDATLYNILYYCRRSTCFRRFLRQSSGAQKLYTQQIWCGFDRASSIICGNKMPTRCNWWIFIADLTACSTCFGDNYAHHQELESIIQAVAACRIWCLVFKLSVWCGAEGRVSGTQYTPQLETLFTNIAGHLTTYFYWVSTQNCNFIKVRHKLPDDGPDGPKHVEAIMRYFNCIF